MYSQEKEDCSSLSNTDQFFLLRNAKKVNPCKCVTVLDYKIIDMMSPTIITKIFSRSELVLDPWVYLGTFAFTKIPSHIEDIKTVLEAIVVFLDMVNNSC